FTILINLLYLLLDFSMLQQAQRSTLFPYTTLFRSKKIMHHVRPMNVHMCFRVTDGAYMKPFPDRDDFKWFYALLFKRRKPFEIIDRKSTRLNSSHVSISYAVFCLKKKMKLL